MNDIPHNQQFLGYLFAKVRKKSETSMLLAEKVVTLLQIATRWILLTTKLGHAQG
jgi:hypothetical protein